MQLPICIRSKLFQIGFWMVIQDVINIREVEDVIVHVYWQWCNIPIFKWRGTCFHYQFLFEYKQNAGGLLSGVFTDNLSITNDNSTDRQFKKKDFSFVKKCKFYNFEIQFQEVEWIFLHFTKCEQSKES